MKTLLSLSLILFCCACEADASYSKNYIQKADKGLKIIAMVGTDAEMIESDNLETDSDKLLKEGYILIGISQQLPKKEYALYQGNHVKASKVLIHTRTITSKIRKKKDPFQKTVGKTEANYHPKTQTVTDAYYFAKKIK